MEFNYASRPIYLETDASCASFRAGLLQVIERVNFEHDEVPVNVTMCPVAFAS